MTASEEKFTRQTLLDVQPLTPNLFTLRTTRDAGFRFRAGQFARLGVVKADGSTVWRAYSMVSSPYDEFLEFFSIVVPGGEFTSELSRLGVGDTLLVDRQAYGYLTLDRFVDGRDLWLLSTGTGLAPFLSILQDFEVWENSSGSSWCIASASPGAGLSGADCRIGAARLFAGVWPQVAAHQHRDSRTAPRRAERTDHHPD